ncbi:pseudouridine synthase [Persephonella sp.]
MIRLNRFISQSGVCSRRKADLLIKEGRVKVNGKVVTQPGIKIDPERDTVELDGKLIKPQEKKVYIKIYKPRGYLTQLGKDKFGRKTLTDLMEEVGIKEKVFPAGRLDLESEGLLILTNDGDFANIIMHPKKKIPKKYVVEVKGRVSSETFNKMKKGKKLDDTFLKPDDIKILRKKKNSTLLEITIHSGQKRIIRRFMKSFGHPVLRLIRVGIDGISLDRLKPSQWKYLSRKEIESVVKSAS